MKEREMISGYDELGRPVKDLTFMEICFVISKRSIDTSSKCGCLAVADDGALLTAGYNNPVRGSDDKNVPIEVRPEKYSIMEHAERNSIFNSSAHGIPLKGCMFYVTGFPCVDCLRAMIQVGAKKIIYGPNQTKMNLPLDMYSQILKDQPIVIERFKYDEALYNAHPFIKAYIDKKKSEGIEDIDFEWNKEGK